MIKRWFHIFTRRDTEWVTTVIPEDDHLWDLLLAMWVRGAFTGPV